MQYVSLDWIQVWFGFGFWIFFFYGERTLGENFYMDYILDNNIESILNVFGMNRIQ